MCWLTDLYTLQDEYGNIDRSIDDFFRQSEDEYFKVVYSYHNHFIEERNFNTIPFADADEKQFLARFLFNQLKRVPKYLDKIKQQLADEIKDMNDIEKKTFINVAMANAAEKPVPDKLRSALDYLLEKSWSLHLISDVNKKFITSDCPVTLMNNDGIGRDETEILFPLNERMALLLHKVPGVPDVRVASSRSPLNHHFIREINLKIAYSAHRYIFSSCEPLLCSIKNTLINLRKGIDCKKHNIK